MCLGAVRAGISTNHSCSPGEQNALDYLPQRSGIRSSVHPGGSSAMLALTLLGASFKDGKLLFGGRNPADVAPLTGLRPTDWGEGT